MENEGGEILMENEGYDFITEKDLQEEPYKPPVSYKPPVTMYWNNKQRIKWNVTLFFGCFLLYSARTTMSICAVEMGKEFGWDKRLSGMVMSSFFFGYIMTQIVGGVLSDRFGGERVLYWSAMVWSAATLALPITNHLPFLPLTLAVILLRALAGVAQGFHFPAIIALVSQKIASQNRNSAFSFAASGTAMGSIFAGVAGSLLLEWHGWRSVFLFIGGLSVLWTFVIGRFITQDFHHNKQIMTVRPDATADWTLIRRNVHFWALMFCSTCESLVFTNLLSWLPTYFHDIFPKSKGWLFNVTPWVASFIVQNTCGLLTDKMLSKGISTTKIRKLWVGVALLPTAILCLVLNHVWSFETTLFLVTVIIGILGANSSGIGMNPQDLAPEHAGSLSGIVNTLGALSGMLGVYLTGHVLDEHQEWSVIFTSTSIISFLGAFSFLVFGSAKQIV